MENKNELRISLIQDGIVWESCAANLAYLDDKIRDLAGKTDVIILPEMFTTGFSMRPHLFAEELGGVAQQQMQQWSTFTGAAVCGSIMISENNQYVNRFFWFEPKPNTRHYDKAHLFRMGEEQVHYNKGNEQVLIEYLGWKIAPFICYDLRFPVWIRRHANFNYDVLIFVANWPSKRIAHWRALTLARAIENQAFLAGVNRIGEDVSGIPHNGQSCIINPMGEYVFDAKDEAVCQTITIEKSELEKYRESFPVGLDTDSFLINRSCNDKESNLVNL
jgi:omega-amidase